MWNARSVGQVGPRLGKKEIAVAGPVGRCGNRGAIPKELVGERGVCEAIVHSSVTFHRPTAPEAPPPSISSRTCPRAHWRVPTASRPRPWIRSMLSRGTHAVHRLLRFGPRRRTKVRRRSLVSRRISIAVAGFSSGDSFHENVVVHFSRADPGHFWRALKAVPGT